MLYNISSIFSGVERELALNNLKAVDPRMKAFGYPGVLRINLDGNSLEYHLFEKATKSQHIVIAYHAQIGTDDFNSLDINFFNENEDVNQLRFKMR